MHMLVLVDYDNDPQNMGTGGVVHICKCGGDTANKREMVSTHMYVLTAGGVDICFITHTNMLTHNSLCM